MILTATAESQHLLSRLCALSIARIGLVEPVRDMVERDAGLRAILRSSARRLFESQIFARDLTSDPTGGSCDDSVATATQRPGRSRSTASTSIDWSNVGYDPRYRGVARLGRQDELRLIALAKAGDAFARQKLTVHYLPLLYSVARRFRGLGLGISELVNEGIFGLVHAIERFEVARDLRFGTYAKWWMRDAMEHAIATQSRLVRLPVNVLRVQRKEARAMRYECTDASAQIRPTEREVPDDMDSEGADTGHVQHNDDHDADFGVDEATPETLVGNKQRWRVLAEALSLLSAREQEVLVRRFGLKGGEPRTLMTTARELNLSHERVRQVQNAALQKLRDSVIALEGGRKPQAATTSER
jgi:RNA polymerase nonessential primary-like sigma factor